MYVRQPSITLNDRVFLGIKHLSSGLFASSEGAESRGKRFHEKVVKTTAVVIVMSIVDNQSTPNSGLEDMAKLIVGADPPPAVDSPIYCSPRGVILPFESIIALSCSTFISKSELITTVKTGRRTESTPCKFCITPNQA